MLRKFSILLFGVLISSALAAYMASGEAPRGAQRYSNRPHRQSYATSLKRMGNISKYENLGSNLQKIYNSLQKRAQQVEDHGPLYKPHRYNYRRNMTPTTMKPASSEYRQRPQPPRSKVVASVYRVPTVNRNRRVNSLWHPYVNRLRSRTRNGYRRPTYNWKKTTSQRKTWNQKKNQPAPKPTSVVTIISEPESASQKTNEIESVPSSTDEPQQIKDSAESESSYNNICPTDFMRLGNGCYYISKNMGPWQWAHFECRARDSQLAVIDTAWEDSTLRAYLNNQDIAQVNRWIGGIHDWNQREWVWGSSGKSMKYQGFVTDPSAKSTTSSPLSSPQWACVLMDAKVFYRWSYDKCTDSMHFVCEAPFVSQQ